MVLNSKKYATFCIITILMISSFGALFAFLNSNSFLPVQAATTETPIGGDFGGLTDWSSVRGSWNISSGIPSNTLTGIASSDNWALIHAGDTSWTNYQVTVNMSIQNPGGEACLIVRYRDDVNFYWISLGAWNHKYSIGKVDNDVYTELAYSGLNSELQAGRWYAVTLVAIDGSLKMYVDGVKVLEVNDNSHQNGAIGFRTYGGTMKAQQMTVSYSPIMLWSADLTVFNEQYVVSVCSTPDINGDGHEDILAVTKETSDVFNNNHFHYNVVYLLDGLNGNIIRTQVIEFNIVDTLVISKPSFRIVFSLGASADGGRIRVYDSSLTEITTTESIRWTIRNLKTFTGNEVIFYYGTLWGEVLECHSLTTGKLIWSWGSGYDGIYDGDIYDELVLDNNRIVVVWRQFDHATVTDIHYYLTTIDATGTVISQIRDFAGATKSDTFSLRYYDTTHFLFSQQKSYVNYVGLSNTAGEIAWKVPVANTQGNKPFTIPDVNQDGASDILVVVGANLCVLNGKNGIPLYNLGAVSASNVTAVAIASDVDGDGISEVAVKADKLYLISFKPLTYSILWQYETGINGVCSIQDINGDNNKDIVLATGTILTAFSTTNPTSSPSPTPSPTPTTSPSPTPTQSPTPSPTTTPSPSPSPSPSPTPTTSPSPTPTQSPTPSPTTTANPSPSPTSSTSPSTAPTPTSTPTITSNPTTHSSPTITPTQTTTTPTPTPSQNPLPSPSPLSQTTEIPLYLYAIAVLVIALISIVVLGIVKRQG